MLSKWVPRSITKYLCRSFVDSLQNTMKDTEQKRQFMYKCFWKTVRFSSHSHSRCFFSVKYGAVKRHGIFLIYSHTFWLIPFTPRILDMSRKVSMGTVSCSGLWYHLIEM